MSKKSKVKSPALPADRQKSKRLKAAVIGAGSMGRHHVRNYFQINKVDLIGICDQYEKLGKKLAEEFNTKYYKDYKEMLDVERPDLVSIAAPTNVHYQIALEVIRRKINLLIEKPIAFNINEAEEIIEEAKRARVKLTVGHIERFNPAVIRLKELIREGKLGIIISVMTRRAGTIPARIKDANVVLDIGVHDIDLLNFILDSQPVNVYASGGRAILKKYEDYADIFLEYPSAKNGLKVTGHIQANWVTPIKIRKMNVTGTKGYAVLNLVSQELVLFNSNYTQEFDDFKDFVGKFKESKGRVVSVDLKEPLRIQLEKFIDAVVNKTAPEVSPEDALLALRTAVLATETIRIKGIN
jgi:UDP-N-acetylglucosamine 3-dehydrogenase